MEKTNFDKVFSCSDCRFSDRMLHEPSGVLQVICRHKPPTVANAFVGDGRGGGQVLTQSVWPIMAIGDYCSLIEIGERPNRMAAAN